MTLRVVTPPTGSIITLAEAKLALGISSTDTSQDALVTALLDVATTQVENHCQRAYRPQVLEWSRDDWFSEMRLPIAAGGGPANMQINSIKYAAMDLTIQTLAPTMYWSRPSGETLAVVRRWWSVWPFLGDGQERVVINFSIISSVVVPAAVKQAALMVLGTIFEMSTRSPYVTREQVDGVGLKNYLVNAEAQKVNDRALDMLLQFERWS